MNVILYGFSSELSMNASALSVASAEYSMVAISNGVATWLP